jgi:pimeloyl-ACP methyl ester carboxylesterase
MWERQLALADGGWRIIAPQLRGFDVSRATLDAPASRDTGDQNPGALSVADYAGDVIDLLDALHVQEAVIGGLSMGGYIAFALLRHAARYVQGLVLADTRPQADSPEGIESRKKLLALLREKGVRAVADEMLPKLLAEETRQRRPEIVDRVRALVLANPPEAIAGAISALMSRPDSTPLLGNIHCPSLIIVGEHDGITPPAVSEAMNRAIAGSELVVLPHAGHLSNVEQPDAFNAALARFLSHRL